MTLRALNKYVAIISGICRMVTVSIVGLQRTGTNHLELLLSSRFHNVRVLRDFWKHALLSELNPADTCSKFKILLCRHPAMWLQSCVSHHSQDLLSTRKNFIEHRTHYSGYAQLYEQFYTEWLDHIDTNDGVIIRHEDVLKNVFDQKLTSYCGFSNEDGPLHPEIHGSIIYTNDDLDDSIKIRCRLNYDDVFSFWKCISPNLINRLGYNFDEIDFVKDESTRALKYKLTLNADRISLDELASLQSAMERTSPADVAMLNAFARRLEHDGDTSAAIAWYKRALDALNHHPLNIAAPAIVWEPQISKYLIALDSLQGIIRLQTSNPSLIVDHDRDFEDERYEALKLAEKLLRGRIDIPKYITDLNLDDARDHYCLSKILEQQDNLEEAIQVAARAIQLCPDASWLHEHMAGLLAFAEHYSDAERAARQAIAMFPECARHHQVLAETLKLQGRLEEALAAADKAVVYGDGEWDYLFCYARISADLGRLAEAEQCARTAVDAFPSLARCRQLLSDILRLQGRPEDALAELGRAVELGASELNQLVARAELTATLGRLDEAEVWARRATEAAPEDAHRRHFLAGILERQGRIGAALHEAVEAAKCRTAEPWHFHNLGRLFLAGGDLKEAERYLRRASNAEQEDARHHQLLSESLARQGRLDLALQAAEAATGCPNAEHWELHSYGVLLAAAGKLNEAVEILTRAAAASPGDWRTQIELSTALARKGRHAEAMVAVEAALVNGDAEARVLRHFGLLLARQGRVKEARARLRQARKLKPQSAALTFAITLSFSLSWVLALVHKHHDPDASMIGGQGGESEQTHNGQAA